MPIRGCVGTKHDILYVYYNIDLHGLTMIRLAQPHIVALYPLGLECSEFSEVQICLREAV